MLCNSVSFDSILLYFTLLHSIFQSVLPNICRSVKSHQLKSYETPFISINNRRIKDLSEALKLKEEESLLTLCTLENKYEYRLGEHMDRYDKLVI